MQAAKLVASVSAGVLSGAGFLITAGLLHGTTLIVVQACIVTVDVVLGSLGVYVVPNDPPTPPQPVTTVRVPTTATPPATPVANPTLQSPPGT